VEAAITDRSGLDRILARHYQEKGNVLVEACMCADPRYLSIMGGNLIARWRRRRRARSYLVCPECAFWQYL
jgi:hypothetical protein